MLFKDEMSYTKNIVFNIRGPMDFSDIKMKHPPILWAQKSIQVSNIFVSESPLLCGEVLQTFNSFI
jgi:hypothetical protein